MSSSSTITYTRHDARTLPLNCDVAEFHPTRKERLLVACYELKESKDESVPASREGALHVFDVDDEGCLSECATSAANIVPSGVFDAKWRPNSDSENLLAVALADGTTALYRVDDGSDGIQQVSTSGSEDVDVGMTLFCDWSVTGEGRAFSPNCTGGGPTPSNAGCGVCEGSHRSFTPIGRKQMRHHQ